MNKPDNGRQESRVAELWAGLQGYTGHLKKDELDRRMHLYTQSLGELDEETEAQNP